MSYRHPAFATPPAPPGWDRSRFDLIRIVDPRGNAIAWFAPELGATCVGYAIRVGSAYAAPWRQVFRSAGPAALLAWPDLYGCAVLWPFSDTRTKPNLRRWQFVERDPTAAVFTTMAEPPVESESCGAVRLRLTVTLDRKSLSMAVDAEALDACPVPIRVGIRAALASGVILPATTTSRISPSQFEPRFAFGQTAGEAPLAHVWSVTLGQTDLGRDMNAALLRVTFFPPDGRD